MKFIKTHISLIFPLVAILLGLEFFIVFDRTTDSFEKSLQNGYSMIVVSKDEMSIDDFKAWDEHIEQVIELEKTKILEKLKMDKDTVNQKKFEASLPNFYSLKLDGYLTVSELEEVKFNLEKSDNILSIESFQSAYQSKYELFSFIKLAFQTFIVFMSIIGFFLIVKQMEVWNFLHAQRMKIMEIFGASLFLRSKVLINMAFIDAVVSALITSAIFYAIQNIWVKGSQMEILKENVDAIFSLTDVFILLFASICVVMIAVYLVVVNVKEE
ncbi:MAG TPA: cell division protein FtsX [Flavobacteriaceae bacterium]|nr:cell division protein FtsX [Flavobacteriaceae bacterium]